MTMDRADIVAIAAEVTRLMQLKTPPSLDVPLDLREASELCHVKLAWLRERVTRKEIPAYRTGPAASWRVFPADVKKFLMAETNQRPARRKSVLRVAV